MIHPDIKDCERVERELAQLRKELDTLKAENHSLRMERERLTSNIAALQGELAEAKDDLLTGNRLYAELTDRQNDAAALLDSAHQTINRLRGERDLANESLRDWQRQAGELSSRANQAEAARQDTVRELASAQEQYMHRIKQIEDLTTRLTKAEAELEVTRKALKESLVMFPRDFFPKAYASFCAALQPGEPK